MFAYTKVTKKSSQATIFYSFSTMKFSYSQKRAKKEQKPDWISAQTSLYGLITQPSALLESQPVA